MSIADFRFIIVVRQNGADSKNSSVICIIQSDRITSYTTSSSVRYVRLKSFRYHNRDDNFLPLLVKQSK